MKHGVSLRLVGGTLLFVAVLVGASSAWGAAPADSTGDFPRALDSYGDPDEEGLVATLAGRARQEPFNLVATLIFLAAIVHTFLSSRFMAIAHRWEREHERARAAGRVPRNSVHHGAELFHFLGEVEAVFGIWAVALVAGIVAYFDWPTAVGYISYKVNFTEAMFVVVIMTLASTRPILKVSEAAMARVASLFGGTITAWWLTILTLGPILGSFITEPAAMTISALLLADKFYELGPSTRFKYATIGLLFVNVSVGGTLTHFAAPPVLMVAAPWGWGTAHMFSTFGWKAVIGVLLCNAVYFLAFRGELGRLKQAFELRRIKDEIRRIHLGRDAVENEWDTIVTGLDQEIGFFASVTEKLDAAVAQIKERLEKKFLESKAVQGVDKELARKAFDERFAEVRLSRMRRGMPALLPPQERPPFFDPDWDEREDPVPAWVIVVHVLFMGWTIFNAHHPELFVPGLLFFLGFAQVASPYQNRIDLKPPLLVGFFLGGLVVHGGLQGWWIEPVLGRLTELPLMLAATVLTAFNDNAAITYLSTLVPGFTDGMKYAVVAGAVSGGGLTVIANAPNPAGQTLLKRYFPDGVEPLGLLAGALVPTALFFVLFAVLN
jgi:hypothetical protein